MRLEWGQFFIGGLFLIFIAIISIFRLKLALHLCISKSGKFQPVAKEVKSMLTFPTWASLSFSHRDDAFRMGSVLHRRIVFDFHCNNKHISVEIQIELCPTFFICPVFLKTYLRPGQATYKHLSKSMKLFHYLPVGACAAAAALLLASCGVSKRSLKQSNRALTAALQASAQKEQAEALKLYSDTSIPQGEARKSVSRDNPGQTALEQTIIRWAIDSDPQGARVFYRVLSSIPAVVKNTNETYLMTTPYEETRAFNILGLTYENSRDVQIEIKVVKTGYEAQVKRFNVRQAIDQQEISSFFMLVPKE